MRALFSPRKKSRLAENCRAPRCLAKNAINLSKYFVIDTANTFASKEEEFKEEEVVI